MKYILEVCLIAFTLAGSAAPLNAQSPAMQKGVSVELAATTNAAPMPDADNDDAFIVAVTERGSIFLGVDPISPATLREKVRSTPFKRGQNLYIKADARTPYATVLRVLEATYSGGMIPQVLLTAPPESPQQGTMVSPRGLDVMVGPLPSGSLATVVQLRNSGQQPPLLSINGDETSWPALGSTLRQHFLKGDEKVILLKADGRLPFADVARAIDTCHAAEAKVVVAMPEQKAGL
jgi:biopolymer transport protein ExbD